MDSLRIALLFSIKVVYSAMETGLIVKGAELKAFNETSDRFKNNEDHY